MDTARGSHVGEFDRGVATSQYRAMVSMRQAVDSERPTSTPRTDARHSAASRLGRSGPRSGMAVSARLPLPNSHPDRSGLEPYRHERATATDRADNAVLVQVSSPGGVPTTTVRVEARIRPRRLVLGLRIGSVPVGVWAEQAETCLAVHYGVRQCRQGSLLARGQERAGHALLTEHDEVGHLGAVPGMQPLAGNETLLDG